MTCFISDNIIILGEKFKTGIELELERLVVCGGIFAGNSWTIIAALFIFAQ